MIAFIVNFVLFVVTIIDRVVIKLVVVTIEQIIRLVFVAFDVVDTIITNYLLLRGKMISLKLDLQFSPVCC